MFRTSRIRSGLGPSLAPLIGVGLGAALAISGCQRADDEPRLLWVERFRPAGERGVFLNEVLTVHLSAPVDPASVHRSSARVVDDRGRPVEGQFEVDDERLHFYPRAPATALLTDGTFEPGGTYRLELAGFPRPDGIRGREGEPLGRPWNAVFTIASESTGEPLFEDPTLWSAHPLTLVGTELQPTDPIVLACDEALDPRSVRGQAFQLRRFVDGGDGDVGDVDGPRLVHIPLRATLTSNDRGGARVSLFPVDDEDVRRALDPGEYHFGYDPGAEPLLDLGGNRVGAIWGGLPGGLVPLAVTAADRAGSARSFVLDFLDGGLRSPEEPLGVDGTAWWDDGGVVTVRLPAAVGDGRDGAVLVSEGAALGSIAATSLTLPPGCGAELAGDGPIVLRSQGRVALSGRLDRRSPEATRAWDGNGEHEEWIREQSAAGALSEIDFGLAETLSEWIAEAEKGSEPWTVIVAGGDLVIDGELLVDGPLVLVAGGWLRVTGRVSASEVWKSDLGSGARISQRPRLLPLDIDPPATNPLRQRQRWTVLSSPFRPPDNRIRWTSARSRFDPGSGELRLRFLGERLLAGGDIERIGPVDDLVLLEDSPSIRLLVELELGPGPAGQPWTPPRLDAVELAWRPAF